ncbi:MAG: hypothetical protein EXS39_01565 [Opitutaceae bacterium]|nr:hypothetical protein [Opitutaceae bacterium]
MLLSVSVVLAEEATLPKNTVMRSERSLMILKAGTVVQILGRNEKTIFVKVDNKTGTIPVDSLTAVESAKADAPAPVASATVAKAAAPAPVTAKGSAPTRPAPDPAPKAVTTYGKAVEKAREYAAKHEKTLVKPTDEILDGKCRPRRASRNQRLNYEPSRKAGGRHGGRRWPAETPSALSTRQLPLPFSAPLVRVSVIQSIGA